MPHTLDTYTSFVLPSLNTHNVLNAIVVDTPDPAISIPVGIVVGLLASFVQSLGLTIQRKSHVQNEALPEGERRAEYRRPLWLLGFGIFISSNLFGSIFQIASLPVVILAPLGAVSLLWNAFFARLILGDVFSPWMLLSTLCIAGGAVLIAVFGIVPEPNHSLEDLLMLFSRPAFVVYFSLLGAFTVVCLIIAHAVEYSYTGRIRLPDTPPLSPLLAPTTEPTLITTAAVTSSPVAEANLDIEALGAGERTPLLDPKSSRSSSSLSLPLSTSSVSACISTAHTPVFLAMSYASFSGIIAGMCLLLAKSGVELLVLTLGGKNQFLRWQTWMLVLGLLVCALLQLWYMHKSLVLADPTLVCPLAFCFYNLSSIINGLVYFDQFSALSTLKLLLVMLGMIILLAGVWVVSFPPGGNRGIDIGAWGEPEEIALETESEIDVRNLGLLEEDEEEDAARFEDEPLPMAGAEGERAEISLDEELPIALGTDEHHVPRSPDSRRTLRLSTEIERRRRSRGSDIDVRVSPTTSTRSSRRQTDSVLFASMSSDHAHPTTPPRRPRPPLGHAHTLAPNGSFSGNGGTFASPPRQSFPTYSHPLSPGAPGGFSIGLSPVSPGFALVPRRRRVSSMEGIAPDGSVGTGVTGGGGVRRRIVSEGSGGILAALRAGASAEHGQEHAARDGEHQEQAHGQEGPSTSASPEAGGESRGNVRWGILRSLVKYARR